MKLATGALAVGMLFCCSGTFAAEIDLSTWTCKKFVTADKDDVGIILIWLDGYYKEEGTPPIIDTDKFVENAKRLGEYCAQHPDVGLITATDTLFKPKE
jgi:acid stress chaperone HdeB